MTLDVLLQPGEDGGFIAAVPALRGCHSQGATPEEALANIREAAEGCIEAQKAKGAETDGRDPA